VFTPPEIYYDGRSREFSVTPPTTSEAAARDDSRPAPAAPFRLQLVGFVGGEGSYRGMFENLATTEHFLARSGRALPELEVTIRDFQVQRVRRESPDGMANQRAPGQPPSSATSATARTWSLPTSNALICRPEQP